MKLWLLCLYFCFSTISYASTLNIDDDFSYVKASPYMFFYRDTNNTLTLDTLSNAAWQPIRHTNLGGFNTFPTWTKLTLKNRASSPTTLRLKNPRSGMDEIDVFIIRNHHTVHEILGDTRPLALRSMPHRYSVVPILELKSGEEVVIITRLFNAVSSTEGEWEVYSHKNFIDFTLKESLWWGVFIGVNLALFIYSIPILLATKDSLLALFFSGYAINTIAYQLSINGIVYALGFSEKYINIFTLISGILFVFFTILIILYFLKITKHNGLLRLIFKTILLLIIGELLLSLFCLFDPSFLLFPSKSVTYVGLLSFLVWFILFKDVIPLLKDKIFKYIFLGHTFIFFSLAYQLLVINGKFEISTFSIYCLSVGSMLEMYFFALGIAQYIKEIEKEKKKKDELLNFQMRFASIGRVVGNISHQWKVPLVRASALLTHIEAIIHFKQKKYYTKIEALVPEIRSYFVFMQNSIDEFYSLYSKNTHKVQFTLLPVINDVWGMLSSKVSVLNAQLSVNDTYDTKLFSYEYSFAHILIILIDNALDTAMQRHIQNPHITITIHDTMDIIQVIVEDNCGGIVQKPIESIFEIDISSKKESSEQGGLGLAIVQTLVNEKFHGTITASNTNNGARFCITLPNENLSV